MSSPDESIQGPDRTLEQLAGWLTSTAATFDALFQELPRLQAVQIAEELTEQHPEEEHEMTSPRAQFLYLNEGGRKQYCSPADIINGAAFRLLRAVHADGSGIRARCAIESELFHYETYQLTVHREGRCEGRIRHWDFDGAGPEYVERLEQMFEWKRDGSRYVGRSIELRLGGPHISRFLARDGSEGKGQLQDPASIYEHAEVTPYRDEAFRALFRMKWRPARVELRKERIAILFNPLTWQPRETTHGASPSAAGRGEAGVPVERSSKTNKAQVAWVFRRSTLDRYCPKFEPEYPPGIDYFTTSLHHVGHGQPVDVEKLPQRMRQTSSHKQLPDYLPLVGMPVISRAFRELIEALEPGIHQLIPIQIVSKDGDVIDDGYSILNALQRLDAIILEQSNITWFTRPDGTKVPTGPDSGFVVDSRAIGGRHMWHNAPFFGQHRFISNALKEAIETARLKQLQFTEIRVADRR